MSRGNRGGLLAIALACLAAIHCGDDTMYRYKAPIAVERPGTFVLVQLPAEAYARSRSGDLEDLRVADARGNSVPFALLSPRQSEVKTADQAREASIYPLPPKPSTDGTWVSPIELTVQGDRIDVRRRSGARDERADGVRSGGWLVDLGERKPEDPRARMVRFEWSGPKEFTAAFEYDTSDDLRRWQSGGPGQLMALSSPSGTVSQRDVVLQPGAGRFVRIVWADAANAPAVTRAQGFYPEQQTVELDPPVELIFSPVPPASKEAAADAGPGVLYYDLGGSLPIGQITMRWDAGTHVVPARVEGQDRPGKGWWPLANGVFYQIERNGVVGLSAFFTVSRSARYVRVVPDPRAGSPDPKQSKLLVRAHLASLLFAAQGEPPYSLFVGSAAPSTGPLPPGTLVPSLEDERPRFGTATLGAWSEDAAAARQAESAGRRAALRLGLLWTVLIVGVASLAFMVWRLARSTTTGK